MSNLHDFLVEHAISNHQPDEDQSVETTDISLIEVGLLEKEWKANHAVRDNTLIHKLCSTLKNILGDTLFEPDDENQLLSRFSPRIQLGARGQEDLNWRRNPREIWVSVLIGGPAIRADVWNRVESCWA